MAAVLVFQTHSGNWSGWTDVHQVVEAQQELEIQKAQLILTHLQKIKHFYVKPCKKEQDGQEIQVCSSALALRITALGHPV